MNPRRRGLVAAVVSALLGAGALVAVSTSAQAVAPQIFGRVTDRSTGDPVKTVKVLLFTSDFTYVKQTRVRPNGVYQLTSPGPGAYHLQFVDGRPAYDTKAYAPRLDVVVRIGTQSAQKNVRMSRGGAIGGTVKVRGKLAPHAQVRAVSDGGQVITVTADEHGSYALAGLGKGTYRVSASDTRHRRVGRTKVVRSVRPRSFRVVSFDLRTRPGTIRGFLLTGGSRPHGIVYVTAVNRRTGEFWVQRVAHGNISLRGLTPGSYRLQVPDVNGWYGTTVSIGSVKPGRTRNVTVRLTTRGGTFAGRAVDKNGAGIPNISVRLTDARGRTLDERPAAQDGTFTIGGTARQQAGVTVTIFAYSTIQGHTYQPRTFTGLTLLDDTTQSLGQVTVEREPDPTPAPTKTTPTPKPTATTSAPPAG